MESMQGMIKKGKPVGMIRQADHYRKGWKFQSFLFCSLKDLKYL